MGAAEKIETVEDTLEADVREALRLCNGDAVAALRVTLVANAFLDAQLEELSQQVFAGYRRAKVRKT